MITSSPTVAVTPALGPLPSVPVTRRQVSFPSLWLTLVHLVRRMARS